MSKKNEFKELFREPGSTGLALDRYRVLVLNADFRPFFYCPLSTAHWKQVMFLHVKGEQTGQRRFNVVEYYPDVYVHGGFDKQGNRTQVQLPSVISHLEYRPPPHSVSLNNDNLWLRDGFTCQYTGERCSRAELSRDHVWPRAKGGEDTWDNVVAAKKSINELKDDMTPAEFEKRHGLKLIRQPREPSWGDLFNMGKQFPPAYLHETWADYLYWEIDPGEKVA